MFGAQEVRGKLHRRLVPIYFIFQTWARFSPPQWVGGLFARGTWPAGGDMLAGRRHKDLKGWGWWGHTSLHSAAGCKRNSGCVHFQGAASTLCSEN